MKWQQIILRLMIAVVVALVFCALVYGKGEFGLVSATNPDADVTVTYQIGPVTAPTVTNGTGATNVTYNSARLNGEITDNGYEDPTAIVYYGKTDGGTTPGSWSNNSTLGTKPIGTFYKDVESLDSSTVYYYRMYAYNTGGSDWANSTENFTTEEEAAVSPTAEAIDNLTLAMQEIKDSLDEFNSALTAALNLIINALQIGLLFEMAIFFGMVTMAFWRRDMMLFIVSGLVTIFISLSWIDDYPGISIVLIFLAGYQLFKGVTMALEAGGPAKGIRQFKGIYNRVRGIFKD